MRENFQHGMKFLFRGVVSLLSSLMYAYLIVAMSGTAEVAYAVSCTDVVSSQTTYRYNETLFNFRYFNGKTYAIALSGITGRTILPDNFFAFTPNFTHEYLLYGDDSVSLKKQLASGKYGAARPVAVTSEAIKNFLVSNYGQVLQGGSLVDVWKEYGSVPFTTIGGAPLSYTNWATPPTPANAPSAVKMDSAGLWSLVSNGYYTSQLVEFDGKLDCSIDLTGDPPPPIDPPGGDGGLDDIAGYDGLICLADLNGDGELSGPFETAKCQITAQGNLCPVGALECDPSFRPVVCPSDSTLNTDRDMCQKAPEQVNCPTGYTWDQSIDKCVMYPPCPEGGTYNALTDRCEKIVQNECPGGYTYDAGLDVCHKAVDCGTGGTYNSAKDRCEKQPEWGCPTGFTYNSSAGKCEALPYCPSGSAYNTARDRCEAVTSSTCPAGYSYDVGMDKCISSAGCTAPSGLNPATDLCEVVASTGCPVGTAFNAATSKCEATPTCAAGGSYSSSDNLCTASTSGTACPGGYTYSATYGKCVATPSCVGGSYNAGNNRCEASPSFSCPDASYTYNVGRARCEKAPICPAGMTYNSTYDVCTQNINPTCTSGYTYNSTRNRCEKSPECSAGTFNPTTNKCEKTGPAGSNYPAAATPEYYYWVDFIGDTYCTNVFPCQGDCSQVANTTDPLPADAEQIGYKYCGSQGGSWDRYYYRKLSGYTYSCLSGGILNGSNCYIGPTTSPTPIGQSTFTFYKRTSGTKLTDNVHNKGPTVASELIGQTGTITQGNITVIGFASDVPFENSIVLKNSTATYTTSWPDEGILLPSTTIGNGAFYISSTPIGTTPVPVYKWSGSGTAPYNKDRVYWKASPKECTNSTCSTIATITTTLLGYLIATGSTTTSPSTVYQCPDGTYTTSTGVCSATSSTIQTNPTCTNGTFDSSIHACYASYTPSCSQGTYNSSSGLCTTPATCSSGLLDVAIDVCYQNASSGCPGGYSFSGGVCIATPSCNGPGSFDGSIDYCTATATYSCPSGYSYNSSLGLCSVSASCVSGTSLNTASDLCEVEETYGCPGGFSLTGTTCYQPPTCAAGGAYSASLNLCHSGVVKVCGQAGFSLDLPNNVCQQAADCGSGSLNASADKCEAAPAVNCSGWTWDSAASACYSTPTCDSGAYNSTRNQCEASVTKGCGTYSWDAAAQKCRQTVACPTSTPFTTDLAIDIDRCVSSPDHVCALGLTWIGLPVMKCESVPICDGAVFYDSVANQCLQSYGCPYGSDYTCMQPTSGSPFMCSPYQCVDAAGGEGVDLEPFDETYLQDDGETDEDGNCLGQVYIFNGKPSRCRPTGWTVGYINNCCANGDAMPEDTGSAAGTVSGAYNMYKGAAAAYAAYNAYNTVAASADVIQAAGDAVAASAAAGASAATQAGVQAGAYAAASGTSQAGAMFTAGIQAMGPAVAVYAAGAIVGALGGDQDMQLAAQLAMTMALMSGPQMVVGIVVLVVMRFLMGTGCDANDIMTANDVASDRCHYVGSYCEKTILGMCVQKAKGYCCFNSILSRIIHEQGRPQLVGFGPNGKWGPASKPYCRGFTPEEFQSLDFQKIDLTEYYGEILDDISERLEGAGTRVEETIKSRFQQMQNNAQ